MADGIDATMNPVQPSARDASLDCPLAQAKLQQLSPGYHAVLPLRERRDCLVRMAGVRFSPYGVVNHTLTRHADIVGDAGARVARWR
jgi:hypothetical protein